MEIKLTEAQIKDAIVIYCHIMHKLTEKGDVEVELLVVFETQPDPFSAFSAVVRVVEKEPDKKDKGNRG